MKSVTPWIIILSIRLYRWLLHLGPEAYRREYEEPTLQVFRLCCRDVYQQRGTAGVVGLWFPLYSEVIVGMMAEQVSAERLIKMLPAMRRSMIYTFGAFILFGLAFGSLLRIIDPLPPFEAVAAVHPELGFAYSTIRNGAYIALLTMVVGGGVVLMAALRYAIQRKRRDILVFLGVALLALIIFGAATLTLLLLPHEVVIIPWIQLIYVISFLLCLVSGAIVLVLTVLRSEFSPTVLRIAIASMLVTVLAMVVASGATIFWMLRLWADAPQFAESMGLGPGLTGGLGGSTGVAVVVVMMTIATIVAAISVTRGFRARMLPSS